MEHVFEPELNNKVDEKNRKVFQELHSFWGRVQYGVYIFTILFLYLITTIPPACALNDWATVFYRVSYQRFGFVSRGLVGTIIAFFHPDFLTSNELYLLLLGGTFAAVIFVAVWLNSYVRSGGAPCLGVLFCVNPFSVTYCFGIVFGRFDLLLIVLFLLIARMAIDRSLLKIWVVPILCAIGIMIHHGFYFLFLPPILVLLRIFNRWGAFWASVCLGTAFFIYFQWFGKPSCSMVDFLIQIKCQEGNPVIFYEYYGHMSDHLAVLGGGLGKNIVRFLAMVGIASPLFVFIVRLWWRIMRVNLTDWKKYAQCLLVIPATFPIFLGIDWGRWLAAIVIGQFVLLATLAMRDESVRGVLWKMEDQIKTSPMPYMMLVAYLTILPRVSQVGFSFPIVAKWIKLIIPQSGLW